MAVQLDRPTRDQVVARNRVTIEGRDDGPVLVFAHGFGCDQDMWRQVVPLFVDTHRVVLFDHVGSGGSDLGAYDPEKYSTLQGYAADIVEICEALDLTDVTLVGHSVSAMIALEASILAPELFRDLVLVAPSPSYVDDPESGYVGGFSAADIDELLGSLDANYYAWAAATAPMVMGNPSSPELGERLTTSFCRTDPDMARSFAHVTFRTDSRHLLDQVAVPALVLQCSNDVLAPPVVGRYLHERLTGSTLAELAASGHCPHVSAPEETASAISSFLSRSR